MRTLVLLCALLCVVPRPAEAPAVQMVRVGRRARGRREGVVQLRKLGRGSTLYIFARRPCLELIWTGNAFPVALQLAMAACSDTARATRPRSALRRDSEAAEWPITEKSHNVRRSVQEDLAHRSTQ